MNVKGNHVFNVSRQKLWKYLMDPDVLAKITPGVTKLKVLDTDSYQSVSDIKIGPVKGSFKGKLKVIEKNEPTSFSIQMEQLSKIGNAHATVQMNLADAEEGKSELSFDGKAKLSGVIARTGQRVLSGVANTITREVFASLEKHIEEDGGQIEETTVAEEPEPASETTGKQVPEPIVEAKKARPEKEATGFMTWLKNFFKKLFG